jgi:hypothetical protein
VHPVKEPIGGFFELEVGHRGAPYHAGAAAFCSGRACLRHILERIRPSRAWAPFYICDAALEPFHATGVPVDLYSIDEALEPILPRDAPRAGECLVYVNYFGLKTLTAAALVAAYPGRVIVDDTQAFFARGYPGGWSFNSARKFFGVPDGAYAYGPDLRPAEHPRLVEIRYDHLVNRLLGRQELAYDQYLQSEAQVTGEERRISILSERLLANVDYEAVRARRRRNFVALDEALGRYNALTSRLATAATDVPYCYPLLPNTLVAPETGLTASAEPQSARWSELWNRGLFVPRYWPEVVERPRSRPFEREATLAQCLLPLPIDHRYTPEDLGRVVEGVTEVMGW